MARGWARAGPQALTMALWHGITPAPAPEGLGFGLGSLHVRARVSSNPSTCFSLGLRNVELPC